MKYNQVSAQGNHPPGGIDLGGLGEGLCHLAVASPVAGGDEVGHAAALQEGDGADLALQGRSQGVMMCSW